MRLSRDLILVPCASPGTTCRASGLMMARVQRAGIFELLSAKAWARTLGYALDELRGKSLCELMPLERRAADEVVAALLDEKAVHALEVTLQCKDQRRKYFRFHRRFDPHGEAIYVVADEVPENVAEGPRRTFVTGSRSPASSLPWSHVQAISRRWSTASGPFLQSLRPS